MKNPIRKSIAALVWMICIGTLIYTTERDRSSIPAVTRATIEAKALATDLRAVSATAFRSGRSTYSVQLPTRRGKSEAATVKVNVSGGRVDAVLIGPGSITHVSTPLNSKGPNI